MALTKIDDRGLKTPIDLLDNEKIRLGTGNDLQLYHDGTDSHIYHSTAYPYNDLKIRSTADIRLQSNNTEDAVVCNVNGSVDLYYDNSKKFETTNTGATVTGSLGVGTTSPTNSLHLVASTTDILRVESTDAGDTGANILLYHNSASPADNDVVGVLNFRGKDDGGNETTYAEIRSTATDVTNGTEDGILTFHNRGSGSFGERMRIDSSGNVGIGTTSPQGKFHVKLATDKHIAFNSSQGEVGNVPCIVPVNDSSALTDLGFRANHLNFACGTGAQSSAQKMTIDDTGVGIGAGDIDAAGLLHIDCGTDKNIVYSGNIGEIGNFAGFQCVNDALNANTGFGIRASEIRFAINSNEEVRIDSDGLKFNGDTSSANALDDYEEGTWTPTYLNVAGPTFEHKQEDIQK